MLFELCTQSDKGKSLSAENVKNTSHWWLVTWAREAVTWYWSVVNKTDFDVHNNNPIGSTYPDWYFFCTQIWMSAKIVNITATNLVSAQTILVHFLVIVWGDTQEMGLGVEVRENRNLELVVNNWIL